MRTTVLLDRSREAGNLDARLKRGWAKHHLRALDKEMGLFLKGETYTLSFKDDLETGEYVVCLEAGIHLVHIELIVGDFVACLRASLDYLAYALTLTPGGNPDPRSSFPIVGVWNMDGKRLFRKAVKGIPAEAVAIIESLQPYHRGDAYKATKLWRLHRLWNIDKHRRIPFHKSIAKVNLIFPSNMEPVFRRTDDRSEARFPMAAKGNVYLDPPVKVGVTFGDEAEGIIVPYEELIDIYDLVCKDVFPRFNRFFQA